MRFIQQILNTRGLNAGAEDGIPGQNTIRKETEGQPYLSIFSHNVNYRQITLGLTVLVFGLFIYIADRNFIPFVSVPADQYINIPFHIAEPLSGFLPSFVHALAFCLLCAGILGGGQVTSATICLVWAGVHLAMELGQAPWLSSFFILDDTEISNIFVRYLHYYFENGVFDVWDLVSAGVGCLSGFYLIVITRHKPCVHRW